MIRRFFWFISGAIAGVTGMSWARRKMVVLADQITPAKIVHALMGAVRETGRQLRRAVRAAVEAYQGGSVDLSRTTPSDGSTKVINATHRHNSPRRRSTHR